MGSFGVFFWILISIAGIMAGAWKEWLKFRTKQNELGLSELIRFPNSEMAARLARKVR